MNALRRTCASLLASMILLLQSSASVHAQLVYSGRVYSTRGPSWHQLREIHLSDGKDTALTDSERSHYQPRCTSDGATIFFLSSKSDSEDTFPQEIWRFDRSTGTESLVFKPKLPPRESDNFFALAIWNLLGVSPDGRTIFFTRGSGEVDKFDVKQTRLAVRKDGSMPVLSPEAPRIALVGDDGRLRVIDANGKVMKDFGDCDLPAWSKDGKRLACVSKNQAVHTIDVANAVTTSSIALPPQRDHWDFATSITWNPDGRSLLVGSNGSESNSTSRYDDYWLLNLATRTWKHIDGGNDAVWSADGSAIVYASSRDLAPLPGGKHQEWVTQVKSAEVSTLRVRILVGGLSYNGDPQWCP
ncbi:MAG TPA: hypothetical protein VIX59_02965 [Candidatus Binataceae bacterium]